MMLKRTFTLLISALLMTLYVPNLAFSADAVAQGTDPNEKQVVLIDNINPENARVTLNFQNVLISEVLDYLSETAGLIIVAETYPIGRINLISGQPLDIDEVVALINTILKEKGYAAIRTGRTLKIVGLSEAIYLNIPVTSGNDPDEIADSDEMVTHIIPIRHADAAKLKEDISPLISEDTVISSNEASNSLIVTSTKSNIKRLVKIVKSVDTQMSTVADVKVFLLEYADAENTADLINNVFEQQTSSNQQSSQNAFMRMMSSRGGPGGDRGGSRNSNSQQSTSAASNVPVVADADERTNAVVVSGPADVLEVIEQVVQELDANPDEERSLFVYKLKYADAANIMEKLNSLFSELEDINEQNTGGNSGRNSGGRNSPSSSSSSSSSGDVSDEVYIEADEDTNTLIIMTSSKNYEKIEKVIGQLDIPIPQVLIKVLLAELTVSEGSDIGVDWSVETTNSQGRSFLNSFSYSPMPDEGFVSQIIAGDLEVTLRALEEVGSLNVLSRPYIMTSNNQTATINVGQQYPFITDSQVSDTGSVFNTVEYESIGITLEVTPTINNDGLVIMDVNPDITTPLEDTIQISDNVDATIFTQRSVQCRVAVPNGETVVIGGLMEDYETEDTEKIPLLGDLPLIGGLFQHTQTVASKTELLIFLTPQVAKDITELKEISDFERSKSPFLKDMEEGSALNQHIENMEAVYQENTEQ